MPAADLDQSARLQRTHKGVGHFSIDPLKKAVVGMELVRISGVPFGKPPLFGKGQNLIVEPLDLLVEAIIERSAWPRRSPVLALQRLDIRHGKVEVQRRHAYAQPVLHRLEQAR